MSVCDMSYDSSSIHTLCVTWHTNISCVTWVTLLIYLDIIFHMWLMCDVTHIFLCDMIHTSRGVYTLCVTWFMCLCATWPMPREVYTHYVWNDTCLCVTWLMPREVYTYYVWHDIYLYLWHVVKYAPTMRDVTHDACMWHDSYLVTCAHTICDMAHVYVWCDVWHMRHTHTYMTHDLWGMGWLRLVGSLKS